jgi:hypothetical protein
MFGSNVLEVGIGLIFTFLTVSLVCGQITETAATISKWRANDLLDGLKSLLNDPNFNNLAKSLYNTALVNPRSDGKAETEAALTDKPSYIDPQHFAQALLDTVAVGETTIANVKTGIAKIEDQQIKDLLTSMTDKASGSVDKLRDHLATWFDAGMDRVSGVYKRRTQRWCFFLGLAVAILLNVDTLHIATVLWCDPDMAKAVTSTSQQTADRAMNQIFQLGLPIGWGQGQPEIWTNFCLDWEHASPVAAKLIGWTITAASTLFGTSFWYDALGDVLKLRGTGPAPVPKTPTAA